METLGRAYKDSVPEMLYCLRRALNVYWGSVADLLPAEILQLTSNLRTQTLTDPTSYKLPALNY